MGLPAAMGIVRAHKGAIQVTSEPGKGSRFKVLFPTLELAGLNAGAGREREAWVPAAATILLVDDEEFVRSVTGRMLRRMGFDVLFADDGRKAVSLFRQQSASIACVVLDYTMPEMDGEETLEQMRQINPAVPLVMSSGQAEQEIEERLAGKGLSGFIRKPFTIDNLRGALRQVFAAGKTPRSP